MDDQKLKPKLVRWHEARSQASLVSIKASSTCWARGGEKHGKGSGFQLPLTTGKCPIQYRNYFLLHVNMFFHPNDRSHLYIRFLPAHLYPCNVRADVHWVALIMSGLLQFWLAEQSVNAFVFLIWSAPHYLFEVLFKDYTVSCEMKCQWSGWIHYYCIFCDYNEKKKNLYCRKK